MSSMSIWVVDILCWVFDFKLRFFLECPPCPADMVLCICYLCWVYVTYVVLFFFLNIDILLYMLCCFFLYIYSALCGVYVLCFCVLYIYSALCGVYILCLSAVHTHGVYILCLSAVHTQCCVRSIQIVRLMCLGFFWHWLGLFSHARSKHIVRLLSVWKLRTKRAMAHSPGAPTKIGWCYEADKH